MGLKRNSKGQLSEATSFRTRKDSIYQKGSNKPFRVSRSKFSNFLDCKRCFYLDRAKGLKEPGMPGWSLNSAVDELLKKEFDILRKQKKPHPIFKKNNLNFIPFQYEKMDQWRNSLKGGISYFDKNTNVELYGGLDDIWFDKDKEELVVVDYKAQSSNEKVETKSYLSNIYHQGYKIQMDIYVYILRKMNFKVSDVSYFYVCNGEKSYDKFEGKLNFSTTLVPYKTDTSWVDKKIIEMKKVLESSKIPDVNKSCEHCAYLEGGKRF